MSVLQTESQYKRHTAKERGQDVDVQKIAPTVTESPLKKKYTIFQRGDGETMTRTKNATAEVRRLYHVQDFLLGEGAFGKVFLAHSKSDENAKFAIKILPVANLS